MEGLTQTVIVGGTDLMLFSRRSGFGLIAFTTCQATDGIGVLHAKSSHSFADRESVRRGADCHYVERKCGEQIRRHVERCVSDKIRTVSARLPRRSTSGQRDHSGCQHRRFPRRVSRNGSVRATGYMGANTGVASGRVSGNFGSGTWRAHMEGGNCAGVWTAQRR